MEEKTFKFDEDKKSFDKVSNIEYILEANVKFPWQLHGSNSYLPFLPNRIKINECKNLVSNLYNRKKRCCTNKNFSAGIESWISTKEST